MVRTGRPLAMPAEDRKKEIFAAAEMLFGARGYDQVTMSEIAAQAGMSKKTLYIHFSDKRALLQSLVASSYIWPGQGRPDLDRPGRDRPGREYDEPSTDSVADLEKRLKMVADHVLSARHLKLCRLAIGESIGSAGLADTFYRMGIEASRQSLIAAVNSTEPARRVVDLESPVLADMLFGATIGKAFIDALLTEAKPDVLQIHARIEAVIATLFTTDLTR